MKFFFFHSGIYGTKGEGTTSTYPGARRYTRVALDSDGNIWLFGGEGLDSASTFGKVENNESDNEMN
jgi:hypothetical protein